MRRAQPDSDIAIFDAHAHNIRIIRIARWAISFAHDSSAAFYPCIRNLYAIFYKSMWKKCQAPSLENKWIVALKRICFVDAPTTY